MVSVLDTPCITTSEHLLSSKLGSKLRPWQAEYRAAGKHRWWAGHQARTLRLVHRPVDV